MEKKQLKTILTLISILLISMILPTTIYGADESESLSFTKHSPRETQLETYNISDSFKRFTYDSGLDFEYPEAVRGIYVTGNSAGGSRFEKLLNLLETTDLNSMVIDIKEDHGNMTFKPEEGSGYEDIGKNFIDDPRAMLEKLEQKGVYPIARIVVFKDSVLAKKHPEYSFKKNGEVWTNGKGEAFVSPFQKEVWEYNLGIAKMAAEMGFQEIQFDYVRFAEGFGRRADELEYDQGDYANMDLNGTEKRVKAVTDFVKYAKKELANYDVDVSVDIFGYAATVPATPGIGQDFSKIAKNVDVISSMIYPSHWTPYFGIDKPDTEPYKLVTEYAKVENEVLGKLEDPPVTRPWIQDFEAPWLYSGPAKQYGKTEVEAQIKALKENGINEFLIWNAGNSYTPNVDYTPGK